jgi:hypothetical protein
LTHRPPHQRYQRVEFPAQALQRELFASALGPLDALGYFLCERIRETIIGMIETTDHRKWLISPIAWARSPTIPAARDRQST